MTMADVTVKRHEDFETAFGGAMRLVRHGLGVESFGIQVFDMPPNADRYPEHDHSHDRQEEVYTVLDGVATLTAGGDEYEMRPGMWARVGPGEKRKWATGAEGARVLALGAVPGKAYEVQEFTKPQQDQAG
jgi:quercetin dioxygenase-like cupin family protein